MLSLILAASMLAFSAPSDTVIVFGTVERDLTGDGRPETMRLVGTGPSIDSLAVTFTIESEGRTIYEKAFLPLTRTSFGPGPGGRSLTDAEYQERLDEYGHWFFNDRKFMSPASFVEWLRDGMAIHIERIPAAIARDLRYEIVIDSLVATGYDQKDARMASHRLVASSLDIPGAQKTWEEIQNSAVTVFRFSPGGDGQYAIVWSDRDQRFYRLFECC